MHLRVKIHRMNRLLAIVFLVSCACTDKPPPTPPPTPAPAPPQLSIRPLTDAPAQTSNLEPAPAKSTWEIDVAEFRDDQIENLGLKHLFEHAPQTNSALEAQLVGNPLVQLARGEPNVTLTIRPGIYLGICSRDVTSNLVQTCSTKPGIDFLTVPPTTLSGTRQSEQAVQNPLMLMLGAPSSGQNPRAAKIATGALFNLRVLGRDGDAAVLDFTDTFQEFKGYADVTSKTPVHPVLDLASLHATAQLAPGETLLLATTPEPRVIYTVDRAVGVSDIPVFGRFFVKTNIETNYIRQMVIVHRAE